MHRPGPPGYTSAVRALALLAAPLALAGCSSDPAAPACTFPPAVSGEATTYSGTSAGACMFAAGLSLYAAAAPPVFDGSAACGACVEVTGPAATATLEVVDLCPGCAAHQLDVSPGAWDALTAGAAPGRVPIAWRFVPCPGAGPVRFVAVAGVNPWWVGVVVNDPRYPIAAVELLPAGTSAWVPLARTAWNNWIGSGSGAGFAAPLSFRATDRFGQVTTTTAPMTRIVEGAEATAPQLGDPCP